MYKSAITAGVGHLKTSNGMRFKVRQAPTAMNIAVGWEITANDMVRVLQRIRFVLFDATC
jgi:hypothetical protein